MIHFRSCSVCAILTVYLFCIIGHPIGEHSIKLEMNKDDRLYERQITYTGPDKSSEYVAQMMNGMREISGDSENASRVQKISCKVNNIYVIGGINASVVKLGESLVSGNDSSTADRKSTTSPRCSTYSKSGCHTSDPTKARMPEYMDKAASTDAPKMIVMQYRSTTARSTADNDVRVTCQCPSKPACSHV